MKRLVQGGVAFLLILICLGGLSRLRLETDVLGVLPQNIPEVAALRDYQTHFSQDQEIIVLCKADDPEEGIDPDEIDQLSLALEKAFPSFELKSEEDVTDSLDAISDLTAYLWINSSPESFETFKRQLTDESSRELKLQTSLGRIRTSSDQQETTRLSYDPLGLLEHPAIESLFSSDYSFSSEDGLYQLLVLSSSDPPAGYQKDALTVQKLRETIAQVAPESFTYQLTGGPIFSAEIGSSMEGDMSGTVSLTALLIGGLFLLMQRSFKQLFAVGLCVGVVFFVTLGLAGWFIGSLNLISVGFAAILIGLVIDYAVVILRESHPALKPAKLRRTVSPSVLWAAVTTSAVFGVLGFSSFTGVAQLGQLLAIGLVSGAALMLLVLPHLGRVKRSRQFSPPELRLNRSVAWGSLLVLSVTGGTLLLTQGLPKVSTDFEAMQPSESEAAETFAVIRDQFPAWGDDRLQLLVTSSNRETISQDTVLLEQFVDEGLLESFILPQGLLPAEENFWSNRESAADLSKDLSSIESQILAAGFSDRALGLTQEIFGKFDQLSKLSTFQAFSKHPLMNDLTRRSISRNSTTQDYLMLGSLTLATPLTSEVLEQLKSINSPHQTLTGWTTLEPILEPLIWSEFTTLFIPSAVILLLVLLLIFRSAKDTLLSVTVLLIVLLLVNAIMSAAGLEWNFLNGMAVPLIIGTGIDYAIHLIFALRRNQGDTAEVWKTTGVAIFFCGTSTVIGFSSLIFASNDSLRSMGLTCALGVGLTMLLSLAIIPAAKRRSLS